MGNVVTVQWIGKSKVKRDYTYDVANKIFEVSLADESCYGNIYVKGTPAILADAAAKEIWSYFGLKMERDASLTYYAASGENMTFTMRGRVRIPSDKW